MLREIQDLNKWRNTQCSDVVKLHIFKIPVLCKLIYRFNAIPVEISGFFFFIVVNTNKTIPNFLWKSKGPKRAKPFWKIKIGGLTNFKSHYEPTVFKTM